MRGLRGAAQDEARVSGFFDRNRGLSPPKKRWDDGWGSDIICAQNDENCQIMITRDVVGLSVEFTLSRHCLEY
jgi:hypothetical protein